MKKWLIGILAVVLVIVVVALVLPFVIPVSAYKGQIVERVKAATGRDFAINGPISLSLLPRFAVEANDVSLGNPPGASDKTMMHLVKLQLEVQPLALLSGRLVIDSFVLVDPKIALEVDKQGHPNWQFAATAAPAQPAAPASAPAAPAPAAKPGAGSLSGLHLGDVRLVNGTITYFDARTGKKQEVDKIDASIALPDLDSAMHASSNADWNGKTVALMFDLAQPNKFLAGQSSAVSLRLSAPTITFDFKGDVASAGALKLAGATSLDVPSLRDLAAWTGGTLPKTNGGLGPFKLGGKLAVDGPKVQFSGAQIELDAIKATGDLAVDGSGAKPYIKGSLDVDKLDLNPYLPPASSQAAAGGTAKPAGAPAQPAPAAATSGWSDQPIDMSGLNVANADLALTAGGIVFHKIQIGKSALAVQVKDGRLAADLSQMQLYQGSGTGKIGLDAAAAVPALTASFSLAKVQAQPLLSDAMDIDRLSGNANGNVAVTAHGKSQRELISSLGGKGDVRFADGAIKGINIGSLIHNVTGALLDANSQASEQTAFSEMTGTFTITNGILENKDLDMKSPLLRVAGAGTVDLPQRSVNYRIEPKLAATTQGQGGGDAAGIMVPVVVQGPWANLSYRPDLSGLLKQPGKALDSLKGAIGGAASGAQGAAPNPGALLKGLLGGGKQ